MGILAPMSAYARYSAQPQAEILHPICLQSHLQASPQTPQRLYAKLQNPRTTFENTIPHFVRLKIEQCRGKGESGVWNSYNFATQDLVQSFRPQGGSQKYSFLCGNLIFLLAHAKNLNPRKIPFGRKVRTGEKRDRH